MEAAANLLEEGSEERGDLLEAQGLPSLWFPSLRQIEVF